MGGLDGANRAFGVIHQIWRRARFSYQPYSYLCPANADRVLQTDRNRTTWGYEGPQEGNSQPLPRGIDDPWHRQHGDARTADAHMAACLNKTDQFKAAPG